MATQRPRGVILRNVAAAAVATAVLVLWAFIAVRLGDERTQAREAAVFETSAMTRVIEEQTTATFRVIDTVMIALQHDLPRFAWPSAQVEALDRLTRNIDGVTAAMLDPLGIVVASTVPLGADLELANQPAFAVHLDGRSDALHVDRPRQGVLLDRPVLTLSRRLEDRSGRFAGVLLVEFEVERLAGLYDSLPLRPGSAVALALSDGTLVVRSTRASRVAETRLPDLPVLSLGGALVGTVEAVSVADGVERIFSYRRAEEFPFTVIVGAATAEVFGAWRMRAVLYGGAAATCTLLALTLTLLALRADRRRQEREASLRIADRALQSSTNGIVIGDVRAPGLPVIFCNQAFLRLSGRSEAEVLGSSLRTLFGESEEPSVVRLRTAMRERSETTVELHLLRCDGGGSWCDLTLSTIRDGTGDVTHYVGVLSDVTARREAGAALRAAMEGAEAANAAKSLFLATMSHELRTPLNAIIGFSEVMLLDGAVPEAEVRDYAGTIHSAGHRLLALVNDLLDVAHLQIDRIHLSLEPVSAADVLSDCIHTMAPHARAAGLDLALEMPEDLPPARADRTRLKQVLLHLLSNAVKFTPTGGRITVRARPESGGYIGLAVEDTGVGMNPDDLARVLQPFERGDASLSRRHDGAGLGLFIVQRLTAQMGGTATVDSIAGQGTTVTVRLPLADGGPSDESAEERSGRVLNLARAIGNGRAKPAGSAEVA